MKPKDSKKKGRPTKEAVAYLAARATEAEKQAEAARRLARLAKAKFKASRKAFKQAKKLAKQARKEAKMAGKALKQQQKHNGKARTKKHPAKRAGKSVGTTPPNSLRKAKAHRSNSAATAPLRPIPALPDPGPNIAQA